MPRTLLPVFSAFKLLTDCYKKEEPETFHWLPPHISHDYILAKEALDRIPESREWLKAYIYEEVDIMPFCNPMGETLMSDFGPHHSGASATRLAWNYRALLNDWDAFVLNAKESLAREEYDAKQLNSTDIQTFLRLKYEWQEGKLIREVERLRSYFNIHHDYETTCTMLVELAEEKTKEAATQEEKAKREYFESRISVLEHHYKYPSRWHDSEWGSSLFGSVKNISPEMMEEMERRYPGYKEHIASLTVS
jgi:hypothetical protein